MSVLGGLEVSAQLEANLNTRYVPVVLFSAKGQEQDIATALNSGAISCLVKPWEPDDLEAKVLQAEAAIQKSV